MPYTMRKTGGGFQVASPHGIKAKKTTKKRAQRQLNLLRGIKHGWKPSRVARPGR